MVEIKKKSKIIYFDPNCYIISIAYKYLGMPKYIIRK